MDLTAKLTRLQLQPYCSPDRTYNDATVSFEQADDENYGINTFETCVKIKNTIDAAEETARLFPSWPLLARLTNLESRLWCLTAAIPLRQNPFLTHWVEALQRLDDGLTKPKQNFGPAVGITTEQICDVRVEWIKRLLLGKDLDELFNTTPRVFQQAFVKRGVPSYINLQVYIRMLEEENVYDKGPDNAAPHEDREKRLKTQKPKNDHNQRKNDIREKLEHQPHAAVQELTHLPVALPYLDFLTTLLTDHTLESHLIEPAPVIISYIQHALRLIERMGAPPSAASADSATAEGGADGSTDSESDREYGNVAQSRAVKLLLLFIKALIRKELLGVELLYYEIQEICVRYVWMREVREFKSWMEEGEAEE